MSKPFKLSKTQKYQFWHCVYCQCNCITIVTAGAAIPKECCFYGNVDSEGDRLFKADWKFYGWGTVDVERPESDYCCTKCMFSGTKMELLNHKCGGDNAKIKGKISKTTKGSDKGS